jgi:hypothetical protein
MTTFVWRDGAWRDPKTGKTMKTGKRVIQNVNVLSDIAPFKSPLDFKTEISSRSQLRDYEKRHGVKQVGTDFDGFARKLREQRQA